MVAGGVVMPAFWKSSLLYQKPTMPRLYGTPYCLPSVCQPAAEPPRLSIQSFDPSVRSMTLPEFTWSAMLPPPHCWKTSGGSLDCRATGILVWNCSFWIASILNFTLGCAAV
jgi:hypothetical protein